MEINNHLKAVSAYTASAIEKEAKPRPAAAVKTKNTDKADFSASKNTLEAMRTYAVTAAESSVSPERIAALKAAVENGSYEVTSGAVAGAMLTGFISVK